MKRENPGYAYAAYQARKFVKASKQKLVFERD